MLRYETVPVTAFQQNCSIVWCDRTREAAVIDPGGDIEKLRAAVQRLGVHVRQIWLTHAHIDHAGATETVAREGLGGPAAPAPGARLPIIGPHRDDKFWIDALPQQSLMFGFPSAETFAPDRWLHEGDQVEVGECRLEVRHCPGHTPGHVVFFSAEARRAFVGDVLFAGGIGRTDFPRGDFDTLIASITGRLWPLGDDVVFIPGHGPESSFGHERIYNPYVADRPSGR